MSKKEKRHPRERRTWWLIVSGIAVIVGLSLGLYFYQMNQFEKQMTEQEFSELKDKQMEVIDTSVFTDEKLEKWYLENRQIEGEYLYHTDDSTYVLVSVGEVKEENTFLLINGVKEAKNKLLIGYDTMVMKDVPNIQFEDSIRSALVKVQGSYKEITVIDVEESTSTAPQR